MKIAVVGTGYVGLVAGACFAESGNDVICVDNDPRKLAALRDGRVPFHEPGLPELVAGNLRAGRLRFTDSIAEATAAPAARRRAPRTSAMTPNRPLKFPSPSRA